MPVITRCLHCHQPAQVPDSQADRLVRCPSCQQVFLARRDSGEPPTRLKPAAPQPSPVAVVAPAPVQPTCPACRARLGPGAAACTECGWMRSASSSADDADEQPLVCTNPACGVANPSMERVCQRCHTLLPSPPGTLLHDRYRIKQLLALGGFGAVYLGDDLKTGQPVAIKDMLASDGAAEFKLRLNFFRREAEILRLLAGSPITPRIHSFIESGTTAHLIMEYVPGRDLLKVLEGQQHRPFPVELVAYWGQQVCAVLETLHAQRPPIVHRDLKPDNIMLLEDGRHIKLIDFGSARDLGREGAAGAAKTRVFTEGYAPPEQIIGKPETRSDLFGLAGTLYHLATGRAPEGHYTALELRERLADPKSSLPAADRWFFELLATNLAEDADDRYYSARWFRQDLAQKSLTTQRSCPQCGERNGVREPFCRKCAAALTEPTPSCVSCGKINFMGCRFCTQCGVRMR
ncbi:MAG TPA: protein kinase [Gemmatales bacterium]|nr:protein kinase [Gemmatales bacterium]